MYRYMQNNFKEKIKEDLDFTEEIFKRGVIEGTKHAVPSPETLTRLSKMEDILKEIVGMLDEVTGLLKMKIKL